MALKPQHVERPIAVDHHTAHRSWALTRAPLRVAVASVITVVGVGGWYLFASSTPQTLATDDLPSSAAVPPPAIIESPPAAAPPATPPADAVDRGFNNPQARCGGAQRAVASGRTSTSLVVICRGPAGDLHYRGVRLSLGVGAQIDDVTEAEGVYTARNEAATYMVSPKALTIAAQGAALKTEPMLEYRTGAPPPSEAAPTPAPSPPAPRPPAPRPPPAPSATYASPPPAAPAASSEVSNGERTGTGNAVLTYEPKSPWRVHYSMLCPANVDVGGVVAASTRSGSEFFVRLRGSVNRPEAASGSSLVKISKGPVSVAINPANERCEWKVRVE